MEEKNIIMVKGGLSKGNKSRNFRYSKKTKFDYLPKAPDYSAPDNEKALRHQEILGETINDDLPGSDR